MKRLFELLERAKAQNDPVMRQVLLDEAARLLRKSDSDAGHRQLLQNSLDALEATSDYDWCWIRDVFADAVVYEHGGRLWQRSYAITADEKTAPQVELGEAIEVEAAYTQLRKPKTTAKEAGTIDVRGEIVPLTERAVAEDGSLEIKIIQPGWGSSGYYSPELLRRDGPKVFTEGLHMYWDHPTATEEVERPERSLSDLAGVLTSSATWKDNGPAGPGLYASAEVRSEYREAVEELAPHIGLSIRAQGRGVYGTAEGREGPIIQEITDAHSVDYVTVPGAGGQVLSLFESARRGRPEGDMDLKEVEEAIKGLTGMVAGLQDQVKGLATQNAQLTERAALGEAQVTVAAALGKVRLHEATRARLQADLVTRAPFKDGALDREAFATMIQESIEGEAAYLGQVTGLGRIEGLGSSAPPQQVTTEKLNETLGGLGLFDNLTEAGRNAALAGRG